MKKNIFAAIVSNVTFNKNKAAVAAVPVAPVAPAPVIKTLSELKARCLSLAGIDASEIEAYIPETVNADEAAYIVAEVASSFVAHDVVISDGFDTIYKMYKFSYTIEMIAKAIENELKTSGKPEFELTTGSKNLKFKTLQNAENYAQFVEHYDIRRI